MAFAEERSVVANWYAKGGSWIRKPGTGTYASIEQATWNNETPGSGAVIREDIPPRVITKNIADYTIGIMWDELTPAVTARDIT
jgi:hypothetical protein